MIQKIGPAAGALLPTIRRDLRPVGRLPLPPEEVLEDSNRDRLPGEDLIFSALPLRIPFRIQAAIGERLHPFVHLKIVRPAVHFAT